METSIPNFRSRFSSQTSEKHSRVLHERIELSLTVPLDKVGSNDLEMSWRDTCSCNLSKHSCPVRFLYSPIMVRSMMIKWLYEDVNLIVPPPATMGQSTTKAISNCQLTTRKPRIGAQDIKFWAYPALPQ